MADILPDLPGDLDTDETSFDDAFALAAVIMQMRRRVDDMDKIIPGVRGSTTIEIDGVDYTITLSRRREPRA